MTGEMSSGNSGNFSCFCHLDDWESFSSMFLFLLSIMSGDAGVASCGQQQLLCCIVPVFPPFLVSSLSLTQRALPVPEAFPVFLNFDIPSPARDLQHSNRKLSGPAPPNSSQAHSTGSLPHISDLDIMLSRVIPHRVCSAALTPVIWGSRRWNTEASTPPLCSCPDVVLNQMFPLPCGPEVSLPFKNTD